MLPEVDLVILALGKTLVIYIFIVILVAAVHLIGSVPAKQDNGDSILTQLFPPNQEIPVSKPRHSAQVNFRWRDVPRTGSVMTFVVTYFKYDETEVSDPSSASNDPISISIEIHHIILEQSQSNSCVKRKIDFTTENLPLRSDDGWNNGDRKLRIKFFVRQSGNYEFSIKLDNVHIPESPFKKRFVSGYPDPGHSIFHHVTPVKIFVCGKQHKLTVEMKDASGNSCRGKDIDLTLINLAVNHLDLNDETQMCPTLIYIKEHDPEAAGTVNLIAEIHQPGILHGKITYAGSAIKNGSFDIVALNYLEALTVDYHWAYFQYQHTNVFKGDLFQDATPQEVLATVRRDVNANPTITTSNTNSAATRRSRSQGPRDEKKFSKIQGMALLTNRNLTVHKVFWKYLTHKKHTLRITVHNRFTILHVHPETDIATFELTDELSSTIIMSMPATTLRTFIAFFTKLLTRKLGEKQNFSEKVNYFYQMLLVKMQKVTNHSAGTEEEDIELQITRNSLVDSTRTATQKLTLRDWCKVFRINFVNEPGIDGGGVRREFFELLCTTLFDDNPNGMFRAFGKSNLVHPNPCRNPRWPGKTYERTWEMAGRIVGKCLYECAVGGRFKLFVKARFTRSFLAAILGLKPHYRYFEQDDPELFTGKVQYILKNEVKSLNITFTDEEYNRTGHLIKVVDLIPNGRNICVDEGNKRRYLMALAQYRLFTRVKTEIEYFLRGLHSMVNEDLLGMFDVQELEILMCGKSTYTIEELKLYHKVVLGSCDEEGTGKRLIDWFFMSVADMNPDVKARLLQFTTGCSILPAAGLCRLKPMFTIEPTDQAPMGKFPTAQTCGNLLILYDHATYDSFDKALNLAITEGCEGFAMA